MGSCRSCGGFSGGSLPLSPRRIDGAIDPDDVTPRGKRQDDDAVFLAPFSKEFPPISFRLHCPLQKAERMLHDIDARRDAERVFELIEFLNGLWAEVELQPYFDRHQTSPFRCRSDAGTLFL